MQFNILLLLIVKLGTNAWPKVRQAVLCAAFSSCHVIDQL